MPVVYPQVTNVPGNVEAFRGLGQGGGELLAALINLYRRQGGGAYTSPTGATTQVSPAERVAGVPGANLSQLLAQRAAQGQGAFQPRRMSFLGPVPVNQAQVQKALLPLQLRQAQAETAIKERQATADPLAALNTLIGGNKTGLSIEDAKGTPAKGPLEGFGLTGVDYDPASGKYDFKFGETPEFKEQRELRTAAAKKLTERRAETQEGFRTALGLFQNFNAQFESKLAAQEGRGGVVPGIVGSIGAALKLPGKQAIAATEGQIQETALGLSRVITAQRRVIKGVVEMIKKTIPTGFDTREFKDQKIAQSVSNMFRLLMASNRGIITEQLVEGFDDPTTGLTNLEEFIEGVALTPAEETILEGLIDRVLSTPAAALQSQVRGGQRPPQASTGFKVIRKLP
jgi:hypothetical protein